MRQLDETKQMKAYCNLRVTNKGIGGIVNIHIENVDVTKDFKGDINQFLDALSGVVASYNERIEYHPSDNNEHSQSNNQDID